MLVTVRYDRLVRPYGVLQLKRRGGWHRVAVRLVDWLVAAGFASYATPTTTPASHQ